MSSSDHQVDLEENRDKEALRMGKLQGPRSKLFWLLLYLGLVGFAVTSASLASIATGVEGGPSYHVPTVAEVDRGSHGASRSPGSTPASTTATTTPTTATTTSATTTPATTVPVTTGPAPRTSLPARTETVTPEGSVVELPGDVRPQAPSTERSSSSSSDSTVLPARTDLGRDG